MNHPPEGPYPPPSDPPQQNPPAGPPSYSPPPGYGGQPQYGQPQYGQPQYGHPPYPPPPPNKQGWKVGLIIGGIVLLLCCCGGGSLVAFLGYQAYARPEVTAEIWFDAVMAEDTEMAYDMLCAADRSETTRGELRQIALRGKPVASYTVHGSKESTLPNGQAQARVSYTREYEDGSTSEGSLQLVQEDGWMVCGVS